MCVTVVCVCMCVCVFTYACIHVCLSCVWKIARSGDFLSIPHLISEDRTSQ